MIEMKEKKQIMKKSLVTLPSEEGLMELDQEEKEIYLFLSGGFAAK